MIPDYISLKDLDPYITKLVINLGRIPEITTWSNCQSHVYSERFLIPKNDGWMHFKKPSEKRTGLIRRINKISKKYPERFVVKKYKEGNSLNTLYSIFFRFGQKCERTEEELWEMKDDKQRLDEYYDLLKKDQRKIFELINIFNKEVIDYISKNISSDVKSLPFRRT